MTIDKIIQTGTKTALYANVKRAKVAAIAFKPNGTIIASAHNRRVNGHPTKWTEHAEEVLIQKLEKLRAFQRFQEITILVLRISKKGLSIAKPCKKCQKILSKYKINVMYSDENGNIEKL